MMNNFPNSFPYLMILTWNCNSRLYKINQLTYCITEQLSTDTIFRKETRKPTNNIDVTRYKLHYRPRVVSTRGSSTAIYIKQHILHYTTQNTALMDIDYTSIVLQLPQTNINLSSIR